MFDEDKDTITGRIEALIHLDAAACNLMSTVCLLLKDDDSAAELLLRVREHIKITEDHDLMYKPNYYLDYIKDLLEILSAIETNGPIPKIRDEVRDHYETLLYNRELLLQSLGTIEYEDRQERLRNNYWMN